PSSSGTPRSRSGSAGGARRRCPSLPSTGRSATAASSRPRLSSGTSGNCWARKPAPAREGPALAPSISGGPGPRAGAAPGWPAAGPGPSLPTAPSASSLLDGGRERPPLQGRLLRLLRRGGRPRALGLAGPARPGRAGRLLRWPSFLVRRHGAGLVCRAALQGGGARPHLRDAGLSRRRAAQRLARRLPEGDAPFLPGVSWPKGEDEADPVAEFRGHRIVVVVGLELLHVDRELPAGQAGSLHGAGERDREPFSLNLPASRAQEVHVRVDLAPDRDGPFVHGLPL